MEKELTLTGIKALTKDLKLVVIDGVMYFAEVLSEEGKILLDKAVNVESAQGPSEVIIAWLKAYNMNKLETIELTGNVSCMTKTLTEEQKEGMEIAIMRGVRAMKNAIPNLLNDHLNAIS